jgi:ABC-2 type transport system ATP-binding protein
MIRTEGLTKQYRDVTAVADVDLEVAPGEIYGFLGPNGAGKTTTILMLLGIVAPTRGTIRLFGRDLAHEPLELKRQVGVVCETQAVYAEMTARDYLQFFAELYEVPSAARRIAEVMEALGLGDRLGSRVGTYSRGMQQKLGIARALLHDPPLLILDEPVSGLDPVGIREVRQLLVRENGRGKTIFISSHVLSEIERTAHRVGILVRGRLAAQGSMAELRRSLEDSVLVDVELLASSPASVAALQALPVVLEVRANGVRLEVRVPDAGGDRRADLFGAISGAGGVIVGMHTRERSLEDAFLALAELDKTSNGC